MLKISLLILITCNCLYSQSNWNILCGPSYTNVLHTYGGQQIIYDDPLNAPLWNIGFQFGLEKEIIIKESVQLTFGPRLRLRGDKDSQHLLNSDEYYGIRFMYISFPTNIKIKLLRSKDFFIKGGLSGDYLIFQNNVPPGGSPYFDIEGFSDKWELSGQMGFHFMLAGKLSAEIMYSQGLTNIYVKHYSGGNPTDFKYKHQSFEMSFYYPL